MNFNFLGPVLLNIGFFLGSMGLLYFMQKKFYKFSNRVFVALGLGIIIGVAIQLLYGATGDITKESLVWINVVGDGYIRLLRMIIYPLVFISIITSITNLQDGKQLEKMGGGVISNLMITVAISALIGIFVTYFSGLTADAVQATDATLARGVYLEKTLETTVNQEPIIKRIVEMIPVNPFADLTGSRNTSTIAVVIFAAFLGIAYLGSKKKHAKEAELFKNMMESLQVIIMRVVTLVLRLTPFGILALIIKLMATNDPSKVLGLGYFLLLSYIGIFLIFVMHVIFIAMHGYNPLTYFKKAWPTLVFAFTTRSSAGTMPLTIKTLERDFGLSKGLSNITGSMSPSIGQNACAGLYPAMLAVMIAPTIGINPLDPFFILQLVVIIAISSFGVAGIGGGATFASLIVLSAMNMPVALAGVLIAIEPLIDMARTAANVSGSMVAGLVTGKNIKEVNMAIYNDPTTLDVEEEK